MLRLDKGEIFHKSKEIYYELRTTEADRYHSESQRPAAHSPDSIVSPLPDFCGQEL